MEKLVAVRAWDKREKRMIQSHEIAMVDFRSKTLAYKREEEKNEDGFYKVRKLEEFVLMQSAELCDRNGKEIWEGDIVEMYPARLGVVSVRNGEFVVDTGNESVLLSCCVDNKHNQLEVIGEIYKDEYKVDGRKSSSIKTSNRE